jgi:acetyltransferase-like isoleucine patch superfamily enzyme
MLNIIQNMHNIYWRSYLLLQGVKFKKNLSLMPLSHIYQGNGRIQIGENFSTNRNVVINSDGGGEIIIGDNVSIGCNTVLRSANHDYRTGNGHIPGRIVIDDGVWIGANVVVLPDVHIGARSAIGAGSIVTKDIPPQVVAVGNPCKPIKQIQ